MWSPWPRILVAFLASLGLLAAAPTGPRPAGATGWRLDDPPGFLAAAREGAPVGIDSVTARRLADSLLVRIAALRKLEILSPVHVEVATRAQVRARLAEIAREDDVQAQLAAEERVLKALGLVAVDLDVLKVFEDLLEEQLAGFYDINARKLVLAAWLPESLQAPVAAHELAHALQDQHFSLRVRKKLGFESSDAQAAWHALVEGDASAVMIDALLGGKGPGAFVALADSARNRLQAASWVAPGQTPSKRFAAAPRVIRESITFPYVHGLAFVAALYDRGGWDRIDAAYVHPPATTEQVMHPERYLGEVRDGPVRVISPDLRGLLRGEYTPVADLRLGEFDLLQYLREYIDPEIAAVASAGWGGCRITLYDDATGGPQALLLNSIWDTEDDALEFFGAMIGAMEMRYPEQTGWDEMTRENIIFWKQDPDGRWVNLLRLRRREVAVIEGVPAANATRALQKVDRDTRYEDPTPEARANTKLELPWGERNASASDGHRSSVHVTLPPDWTLDPQPAAGVVLAAHRARGRVEVRVEPDADDPLGLDGYTHTVGRRIQQRGTNVYVHIDIPYARSDVKIHQYIFSQLERGQQTVYYVAGIDMQPGFASVVVTEPNDGSTPNLESDFYRILDELKIVHSE